MSGITLSASVRQNLLSLQSTADLLSTTQNRLATGNKVNSALDNPTNFFTAQGLNNRAGDINNLLDGIGNGVQILQAANTGITSLQKLVDSAKSIANQALQATTGYSTKSQIKTAALTGATADNLLGTSANATAGTVTAGAFTALDVSGTASGATPAKIDGATYSTIDMSGGNTLTFDITVDGGTPSSISLAAADFTGAANTSAVSGSELAAAINAKIVGGSTVASFNTTTNQLSFTSGSTGTSSSVAISNVGGTGNVGATAGISNQTANGGAGGAADALTFGISLDGGSSQTITLSDATVTAYNTAHSTATVDAANLSAADVAKLINFQIDSTGVTTIASANADGRLVFTSATTGTTSNVTLTAQAGTATAGATGIVAGNNSGQAPVAGLSGQTLTIEATAGGAATNITFGSADGEIKTLDQLNTELAKNNMSASLGSDGVLTITTTNDHASSTIGTIGGTAVTTAGAAFNGKTPSDPAIDANAQNTRASLVSQYNTVMAQIKTTAADSSFNGVNLLNGDTLALTFNETGKSKLSIQGVTFDTTGLGLEELKKGEAFLDNAAANDVLSKLTDASSKLRSQASAFGSNLSVVQMRQDFSKQMINVLQTGASNLTLADTNEEAANSQALSTRQSIAVSALSLANQSQQGVLQLLR